MSEPHDPNGSHDPPPEQQPEHPAPRKPSVLGIVLWILLGIPLALLMLALLVLGVCYIGY